MEALATLRAQVRPSLVLLSYPVVRSEREAERTAQRLATELKPRGSVAVGGEGAVAARAVFERQAIEVLATNDAQDERVRGLLLTRAARAED